jgi:cell division inhibitor SulA/protein ImuA
MASKSDLATDLKTASDTDSNTGDERARLFEHPDLWRAGQLRSAHAEQTQKVTPSGFAELDACLPGRGWPASGLSELLLPTAGIGELRLLMPLLKQLSTQMRWIAWINPPFVPYAPALEAAGVDVSRILLIHPKSHKDALWSLERASRSGTCSLALAWLDEKQLALKDTRRLQLAAKQGNTLTCLFRPEQAAAQSSMAELRLQLGVPEAASTGDAASSGDRLERSENLQRLKVTVLKRRGGWPVPEMQLPVETARGREEIREQLSLWRLWRGGASAAPADKLTIPGTLQTQADDVEQRVTH